MSLPHGGADRNYFNYHDGDRHTRRSLTGARIETSRSMTTKPKSWSLPHGGADRNPVPRDHFARLTSRSLTGARIETGHCRKARRYLHVAPSRGRGSKHGLPELVRRPSPSLPHGGADRNTRTRRPSIAKLVAPSRGRGSKHDGLGRFGVLGRVAPSRGRIETDPTRSDCLDRAASLPHGGADRNLP